jgi:two-component system sporulation sensor kinase A
MGTFQDVTDLRLADRHTRESEERFRLLAASTTDLVLMIRADGVIDSASPGASLLGYDPEDLVGRHRLDLVHDDDQWVATEIVRKLVADEPLKDMPRRDYRFRRKDGGCTWMEGNPRIIRDELGGITTVIGVFRDVTVRRDLEERLRAAKDEAEQYAVLYRRLPTSEFARSTARFRSEHRQSPRFTAPPVRSEKRTGS